MSDRYILDNDGFPVKCDDLIQWAEWFNTDRHVAKENVGELYISTVFLGLDHSFGDRSTPILWETMIFPGKDQWSEIYSDRCGGSIDEAKAMHQKAVEHAKSLKP